MKSISSYLVAFFLLFAALTKAQNKSFSYQHYGSEEGLNNSNIQSIKQGPLGLIYICVPNGVFTYDGMMFEKLATPNFKSNSIRNLNFDKDFLLISRDEGVFNYDKRTKTVTKNKQITDTIIDELITAGDFAYSFETNKIKATDLRTSKIYPDEVLKKASKGKEEKFNPAFCLYKTKKGKVLAGRADGLYIFNGTKQEKISEVKDFEVYSITEDAIGHIVLGCANKIVILDANYKIERELFPKFKASATYVQGGERGINKLIADKYDRFWFTTSPDNNLYLYENNQVYDVFENANIPPGVIQCLFKDKNENIWVGTYSDGIYFIQNPFQNNFGFSFGKKNLLVKEAILRDNVVIAATNNGLHAYNFKSGEFKTLSDPDELFEENIHNLSAVGNSIFFTRFGSKNNSSVLSLKGGLNKLQPVGGKYVYNLNEYEAIVSDVFATILKINLRTQKATDTIYSFSNYRIKINCIVVKGNEVLIGTSNGLVKVDMKSKASLIEKDLNYSINHISVIDNKTYIAHDGGISIYEDKKLIEKVGEVQLSDVRKIRFHNNIIWLATMEGLFLCDPSLRPITVYNKSNGLPSSKVNDISFDGDNVCISTDRGVSISTVKDLTDKRSRPEPVSLNSYIIDETTFYDTLNSIKMDASQSDLSINFISPLFTKPNNQIFRYSLDKEKWEELNNSQILRLNSVKGGRHRIKIIASYDKINWSDEVNITIEKEETFSESATLYILITCAGLALVILVSYIWIKQVKKKALKRVKEEQQINLLKHQAMNALLSPHFIFNSLTSIQNYINTNNSLMASEYLAKFSRLIRMIIEKASQSHITLKDEVVRLNYYLDLEKERFKNKFDFTIEVEPSLDTNAISIPNMIIQPHAENSIIHGILPKNEHGTLKIRFAKSNHNELLITIEDDGIGLIKAKEHAKSNHKSLGTSTISNILELNSKLFDKKQSVKMEDKSTLHPPSNGTIITITLEL